MRVNNPPQVTLFLATKWGQRALGRLPWVGKFKLTTEPDWRQFETSAVFLLAQWALKLDGSLYEAQDGTFWDIIVYGQDYDRDIQNQRIVWNEIELRDANDTPMRDTEMKDLGMKLIAEIL